MKSLESSSSKKIVIVGGGFAGLACAKRLGVEDSKVPLDVTLIDSKNHHLFQPLLYQVAMAGLSPAEIAAPIRSILAGNPNTRVLLERVDSIDKEQKTVHCKSGQIYPYDTLVLACGAEHSYFGHDEWEEFAPGLKTLEQATEIRRRVLLSFEEAEKQTDSELTKELLTFVVIGGGPTGVELAGALGEITRYTLSKDFRRIDPRRTRIILIEAGPRVLPSFSESLSAKASRDLEELGVTVWTSTMVTEIKKNGVQLKDEFLKASTVLWAAGVKASELNTALGVPLDRRGRVIVDNALRVKDFESIYVLGDQACFIGENGKDLPGLAPVALQQGDHAAKNILRSLQSLSPTPFHYFDKGQMATIGRKRAIAEFAGMKFSGFLAYVAWVVVHIYFLIGFKNKVFVLMQWAWSYSFYRRGARLIVNKEWKSFGKKTEKS